MDDYSVNFIDVTWKSLYRRNNKSKYIKHLLCFPDHYNGIHKVLLIYYYRIMDFVANQLKFELNLFIMKKFMYLEDL